jgi:hypothetical protein
MLNFGLTIQLGILDLLTIGIAQKIKSHVIKF